MDNNKFPLDRILTVSVTEYCASMGKEPRNYKLSGIHVDDNDSPFNASLIERFREKVPRSTEVVVSFKYAVALAGSLTGALLPQAHHGFIARQYASGTALTLKRG